MISVKSPCIIQASIFLDHTSTPGVMLHVIRGIVLDTNDTHLEAVTLGLVSRLIPIHLFQMSQVQIISVPSNLMKTLQLTSHLLNI